jgi:2-haloacid dehalogenase
MTSLVAVFDAYGTLFDVHAAIARHRDAVGPDADRLSSLWRGKQLEYSWTATLAGRYADFWALTGRALAYALAMTPSVDPGLAPRLLDAYRELDAFADARATLSALKARGIRTAILSNGAPDMLAAAVVHAGLSADLDAILSVDAIRRYKPSPEVYAMVTEHFRVAPGEVVFTSSNRWDVMGATSFGFSTVWVNRAALPDEYADAPPAHVVPDLASLADLFA